MHILLQWFPSLFWNRTAFYPVLRSSFSPTFLLTIQCKSYILHPLMWFLCNFPPCFYLLFCLWVLYSCSPFLWYSILVPHSFYLFWHHVYDFLSSINTGFIRYVILSCCFSFFSILVIFLTSCFRFLASSPLYSLFLLLIIFFSALGRPDPCFQTRFFLKFNIDLPILTYSYFLLRSFLFLSSV